MKLRDQIATRLADLHRLTVRRYYVAEAGGMLLSKEWLRETEKELLDLFFLFLKYAAENEPEIQAMMKLLGTAKKTQSQEAR